MAIKFQCPHCQKAFKVDDRFGGRKAPCMNCKKEITIPKASGSDGAAAEVKPVPGRAAAPKPSPAPKAPETPKPPATHSPAVEDVEAIAAAELTSDAAAKGTQPEQIEFQCPFCDEGIRLGVSLGGKQAPCPHCRRIVKVPMPKPTGPRDWRVAQRQGPAGAKRQVDPALAGTWGAGTAARVSQEALLEADAILEEKEPMTTGEKVRMGLIVVAIVALLGTGFVFLRKGMHTGQQQGAFDRVAALLATPDKLAALKAAQIAELHRGAGEVALRQGEAEKARKSFREARAQLLKADVPQAERDLLATDLALTETDLGGDHAAVLDGTRLTLKEMYDELRQTLQQIQAPEARIEAIRAVSRKLIAKGKDKEPQETVTLARRLNYGTDGPDGRAVVALELLRAELTELAQAEGQALASLDPAQLRTAPWVLALLIKLDKQAVVKKLATAPARPDDQQPDSPARIGYAAGWALLTRTDDAFKLASTTHSPQFRPLALLAVAQAEIDTKQTEPAKQTLNELVKLLQADPNRKQSPWLALRTVDLGLQAGLRDAVQPVAERIADPALRGRAKLLLLRDQLTNPAPNDKVDDSLLEPFKQTTPLSEAMAREQLARHLTHTRGSASSAVDRWDEPVRPFGYLGVALGMLD